MIADHYGMVSVFRLFWSGEAKLHGNDNPDDHELAKLLYVYVRSGMVQAAEEMWKQSGYLWWVGTLGGLNLVHDPNLGNLQKICFISNWFFAKVKNMFN